MEYLYYPGCSLEGTAKEYNVSTIAFMEKAGAKLIEIKDWTCCGASAAESAGELLSLALPARNIAIAEKMNPDADILVPCSACYLNMKKTEDKINNHSEIFDKINAILETDNLKLKSKGKIKIRHILDVIVNDIGTNLLESMIKRKLEGITIAPYYGCQAIRPYKVFDDPEHPESMTPLIQATGADIHQWNMGGKCCGASNMNTKPEYGIKLVADILKGAKGADAIVTVCPMCQMNLEAFQKKASDICKEDLSISILYLPQLLGLAIGLDKKDVRLDLNLCVKKKFSETLCFSTS